MNLNKNQQVKSSFLLPLIINNLGKDISNDAEPIILYSFSMFTLTLIALVCFINVIGYFISLYLIHKYDIDNKYPKLKRLIKYYEKYSFTIILIEGGVCIIILVFIIIINLIISGILTFN
uniref:Uncharacterized protein n=1 Tax=Hypsizygus marmoreus TaxID=39966 RepID=A0A4P8D2S8_HYPMA|nr:hypothetical protein [Hypsizygus marmoreus]